MRGGEVESGGVELEGRTAFQKPVLKTSCAGLRLLDPSLLCTGLKVTSTLGDLNSSSLSELTQTHSILLAQKSRTNFHTLETEFHCSLATLF